MMQTEANGNTVSNADAPHFLHMCSALLEMRHKLHYNLVFL